MKRILSLSLLFCLIILGVAPAHTAFAFPCVPLVTAQGTLELNCSPGDTVPPNTPSNAVVHLFTPGGTFISNTTVAGFSGGGGGSSAPSPSVSIPTPSAPASSGAASSNAATQAENAGTLDFGGGFTNTAGSAAGAAGGGIFGCVSAGGGLASIAADAATSVKVSDHTTEVSTNASAAKDCVIHPLVAALKQGLIAAITQSIINWINSGFEGAPTFVTDLRGFLNEIADNTKLDFLKGSELGFLCRPFAVDVKVVIAQQVNRPFKERIQCSLGDVAGNIERFFSGDFSSGGWPAWLRVHTSIQNSPYGASLIALEEVEARIKNNQGDEVKLLDFGHGYFSSKKCDQWSSASYGGVTIDAPSVNGDTGGLESVTTPGTPICLHYTIVTPGDAVADQINHVLGLGEDQLVTAKEINEIINALLNQLAVQALTALDGLRGLSSRSSSSASAASSVTGGTGSYLDQLVADSGGQSVAAAQSTLAQDIATAIMVEQTYQEVVHDIIANLNVSLCSVAGTNGAVTPAAVGAQIADYQRQLAISTTTVQRLTVLRARVERAESAKDLNAAADDYDTLIRSGLMHTAADIALAENERALEDAAIAAAGDSLGACRPTGQ